jgi:hypothetical protein
MKLIRVESEVHFGANIPFQIPQLWDVINDDDEEKRIIVGRITLDEADSYIRGFNDCYDWMEGRKKW